MKIQAKNGLICLGILGTLALTTLSMFIANDLGITNFILEKINYTLVTLTTHCRSRNVCLFSVT